MSDNLTLKQGIDLISEDIASQFNLPDSEDIDRALVDCDAMLQESTQMCCAAPIEECSPEFLYSEDFFMVEECYSRVREDEIVPSLVRYIAFRSLVMSGAVDAESTDDDSATLSEKSIAAATEHAVDLSEIIFAGGTSARSMYDVVTFTVMLYMMSEGADSAELSSERMALESAFLTFEKIVADAEAHLEKRETIEEIERLSGARSLNLDLNGDGAVEVIEALAVALSDIEFERYLPILDKYGIKHPLDTRKYPAEIKQRIYEIADKVEADIGIERHEDGFCEAFIPAFIEIGEASFADGGLCLGYTEKRTLSLQREPEMTSAEAFKVCMDPKHTFGSCTEMTFKIMGALRLAGVPCHMESVDTERHVFPSYLGVSLDPSHIDEIGWSKDVNPASIYHFNAAAKGSDSPLHGTLASLINPHAYYDASAIEKHVDIIISAHDESGEIPSNVYALLESQYGRDAQSGIFEGMLREFDRVISTNPKTISPFTYLQHIVAKMPNGTGHELGFAIIRRWPENPHALHPLMSALLAHPDYTKSRMGDKNAASRFEGELNTVVARLTDELPYSGFAETLKAQFILNGGQHKEAEELLAKALEYNPNNAQALSLMANIAMASGRYDDAAELIGRTMEVAPNTQGNHSMLAVIAQLRGDIELASIEARKEATIDYLNVNSTLLASSLAITRMKPLEALEILDRFPSDGLWESVLAPSRVHAYLLLGDFRRAKAIISEAIRKEPDNTNLRVMETLTHIFEYNHEAARQGAVKIDNPLLKTIMEINLAFLQNDLDSAEKLFESIKAIQGVDKTLIEPFEVSLLQLRGKLDEARDMSTRMSEEKPHDPTIKLGIVACDLYQGKVPAARKLFDYISAESPELYIVKTYEPLLLLGEKQYRRAIAAADDLLKASPTNIMALTATGLSLTELDRPKAALKIGEKLVKHSPKNSIGYLIKARAYLAKGKISKAEKLLKKVRELEHFDPKEWPLMSSSALAAEIEAAKAKKKSD